ncbi:MAG TPA: hypothetical protein DCD96_05105 [Flavobacteriales bacterium]|nr:hypothetical protein [Flavobacteriales bacterium]HRE74734.1 hypothetical protein [Flavobacteriales bacterium]HRJ35676.1 hypothetical protein [Flavobacteriales bacterium]HRJ37964.1 hypothetical protein [Flavobacteriales bacterium]
MGKLNYKRKFLAVAVLVPVLALLSWFRLIDPTLELKGQCRSMEQSLDSSKGYETDYLLLRNELDQLNQMLGKEAGSVEEINRGIVEFVSKNSDELNISLTEFPAVHSFQKNQYRIFTHQAEIEGSYMAILRLVYKMEREFNLARICSIRFVTRQDKIKKVKKLYGIIYVQNIHRLG